MNRVLMGATVGVVALAAGCDNGPTVAPVSGKVTFDGKPLAGATINFQPNDTKKLTSGPGSFAVTGEDGRYVLQLVATKKQPGAVLGLHQVLISKPAREVAADKDDISPDLLPAKYNKKSALTFDVTAGGTEAADFDLKSK